MRFPGVIGMRKKETLLRQNEPMTQRLTAERIIDRLIPATEEQIYQLTDVLHRAQNRPPEGLADDSIDGAAWTSLQDLIRALTDVREAIADFKRIR